MPKLIIDEETCTGCGACLDVCPYDALSLEDNVAVVNEKCTFCGACLDDCPVAQSYADFNPNEIVKAVVDGRLEEVLEEGAFWNCLDCLTCFELCPQRFGMNTLFSRLKEMASQRGQTPETLRKVRGGFYEKGRVAQGSAGARRRMGLPEAPSTGDDELRKLLEEDGR